MTTTRREERKQKKVESCWGNAFLGEVVEMVEMFEMVADEVIVEVTALIHDST